MLGCIVQEEMVLIFCILGAKLDVKATTGLAHEYQCNLKEEFSHLKMPQEPDPDQVLGTTR